MNKETQRLIDQKEILKEVGDELAEKAWYVSREYDGTHRLASAVAKWIDTVAKLEEDNL